MLASAHALVHPSVAGPAERERHALFLAHMLALAFVALGLAPFFLALHGAPRPAESLVFALSLVPACAAMLVARTGRLEHGYLLSSLALAGAGLVVAFGLRAGPGAAIAWLVAAQVEAAASLDRRVARLGLVAGGTSLAAILAACLAGSVTEALPAGVIAVVAAPALLCAASALARLAGSLSALRADEAKRTARAATRDAAFAQLTLEHIVLGLDADGSVRALASPGSGFLQAREPDILGRGLFDHVHVADRPAFLKLVDDAAQAGSAQASGIRVRTWSDDPARAPHFVSAEMCLRRVEPTGAEGAIVALLRDASAEACRDDEVGAARDAVEAAVRAKHAFLATMSHELRTPLNSIIGFSEILASRTTRPDDPAKQCEYARVIKDSGQHLLGIVNAVLDMSRIQVGTYPIQAEPFDPAVLLDQAIEAVAERARDARVELLRDYPASLEEVVGDKRAIKQALAALLSNAVKFTPASGRVTLAARPEGNALVIEVADTGVGIAAADLARIGDPFFQAGGGDIGRAFDGAGLGFALVRGLVGLHGGALAIESEPDHGTRVTMRLPLDCRAIPRRTAEATIEIVSRRRPARRLPTPIKDAA